MPTKTTCVFGLPCPLVVLTLLACIAPSLLILLGVDLGSEAGPLLNGDASEAEIHQALAGSHLHTLFEWTAFCIAAFTALLAWIHYRSTGDTTAAIIGMTLFCAGSMDAVHTLAATHLIDTTSGDTNLIPFTWALCRMFNGLVVIVGALIVLGRGRRWITRSSAPRSTRAYVPVLLIVGLCVTVQVFAVQGELPTTMFRESLIKRPWDLAPLMVFVLAGATVLPRLWRRTGSLFAAALLLAVVPDVVTQIHMAFGSTGLFDAHFNAAHFTKIIAYMVPFCGLALDYRNVQRAQSERQYSLRRRAELLVGRQADELRAAEQRVFGGAESDCHEGERAAPASSSAPPELSGHGSHCRQLLANIQQAAVALSRQHGEGRSSATPGHIEELLLSSSRLEAALRHEETRMRLAQRPGERSWVELHECANAAMAELDAQLAASGAVVGRDVLPGLTGDARVLTQLYSALIERQLDLPGEATPLLQLSAREVDGEMVLGVQRLGPFEEQIQHGLGADGESHDAALELCRDIIAARGGRLWVETRPAAHRACYFTLEPATDTAQIRSKRASPAPRPDPV